MNEKPWTGHWHVVGAAGVGMSAVAQLLLARGCEVSGSDRGRDRGEKLPVLDKLVAAGLRLVPQDGSGVSGDACSVVASSAVEGDNADLQAARRAGAPVRIRAEVLAGITGNMTCLAVAGTSGKSTVTGMVGWILEQLGADPTVVNGAAVRDWARGNRIGNVRIGSSDLCVVEVDESDRSLLLFAPERAIITNISQDHFELAEARALFDQFTRRVRSGVIVGPGVDAASFSVGASSFSGSEFEYRGQRFSLGLPGRHNIENAIQAVELCAGLGYDLAAVAGALGSFHGIERRLEVVGNAGGVTVIDDYGHNPAKIRAAWEAVSPCFGRVWGVWRPHGFGPLALMRGELAEMLRQVSRPRDRLIVLPVYYAGGTANRTVTSDMLVADLNAIGVTAFCDPDEESCLRRLVDGVGAGDAVLIMGARDPGLPALARHAAARLCRT